MSSNVTWEPVESGWCDVEEDDDDGSSIAWDGVCVSIMMDGDLSWRKLPPDLRLCRAKQVAEAPPATWSQEPPDAEGPLWVWHEYENMAYPYVVGWQVHQGRYVFVLPNGETMELSGMPDGTWYMPAAVPQPPGEV